MDLMNRPDPRALLTVALNGEIVSMITQALAEEHPVVPLISDQPVLSFIDSAGRAYSHDLSTVLQEGLSWLHLAIRVDKVFRCQADCLIHTSSVMAEDAFSKGEVKGIRFQPFHLPQCQSNPEKLVGQGLFIRGLHYPGTVTSGKVSLSCICDFCRKSFRLQSFHAGFGDSAYFYCSGGLHTLIISSDIAGAPAPLSHPDPNALASLEARLPKCEKCGGHFSYLNPLLCPHCLKPFIDFGRHPKIRDYEYYGNYLYNDTTQAWKEG